MKRYRTFKVEIDPTDEQNSRLPGFRGSAVLFTTCIFMRTKNVGKQKEAC